MGPESQALRQSLLNGRSMPLVPVFQTRMYNRSMIAGTAETIVGKGVIIVGIAGGIDAGIAVGTVGTMAVGIVHTIAAGIARTIAGGMIGDTIAGVTIVPASTFHSETHKPRPSAGVFSTNEKLIERYG